jgi:hypothetical protein
VQTLYEFPIFANSSSVKEILSKNPHAADGIAVNDRVSISLENKLIDINLEKPFTIQYITSTINDQNQHLIADKLDETAEENGAVLNLLKPNIEDIGKEISAANSPALNNTTENPNHTPANETTVAPFGISNATVLSH